MAKINERVLDEQKGMQYLGFKGMDCINCKYKDTGTNNGNCEKYPNPDGKPSDIIFKGADCKYFEKE